MNASSEHIQLLNFDFSLPHVTQADLPQPVPVIELMKGHIAHDMLVQGLQIRLPAIEDDAYTTDRLAYLIHDFA